jgi:hypothetical protein
MESPLLPSGVLRPPRGGPSPTHGARSDAYTAPPMASQPPLLSIDITGLQVRSLRGGLGVLKLIPTHVCSWCRGVWSYLGPSRQHPMPPRPELRSYGAHGVQTTVTCTPIRTYHAGCAINWRPSPLTRTCQRMSHGSCVACTGRLSVQMYPNHALHSC